MSLKSDTDRKMSGNAYERFLGDVVTSLRVSGITDANERWFMKSVSFQVYDTCVGLLRLQIRSRKTVLG